MYTSQRQGVSHFFGGGFLDWLPALFWDTKLLPLLVLTRRGAVPVKTSTGNTFARKYQRIARIITSTGAKFCEISALRYCTGNFYSSDFRFLVDSLGRAR